MQTDPEIPNRYTIKTFFLVDELMDQTNLLYILEACVFFPINLVEVEADTNTLSADFTSA